MNIEHAWELLEAKLRAQATGKKFKALPGGTSDEDIAHVEATTKLKLPEDLLASYRLHDGSNKHLICEQGFLLPLWGNQNFTVLGLWQVMSAVGLARDDKRSQPTGPIRTDWWNMAWLPLTENGPRGDHVCLDLAPAPGGTVGQIILWKDKVGATSVLADSFGDWLADLAR